MIRHHCWAVVLLTVMLLAKPSRGRHPKSLAVSNLYSSSGNDDSAESSWLMASDSAATTSRPESISDNAVVQPQLPEQRWIKPSPKGCHFEFVFKINFIYSFF